MGWFLRKSFRIGPLRLNLLKRGLGARPAKAVWISAILVAALAVVCHACASPAP